MTGGNRGIGRAIVERLAREGCRVTFTYRAHEDQARAVADALAAELPDTSEGRPRVGFFQLDLGNFDAAEVRLKEALAAHGPFDGVVHNAAQTEDNVFYFMTREQWTRVIDVSLNSFYLINKLCLPHMISSRWGRIVVLASVSGEAGNRGQANYAAAKGALIAAAKSLAREVASRNVTVNCVSPGLIETDMTANLPLQDLVKLIPQGRVGKPEEIAAAVKFLMSEDASYVVGEVLRVNGGFYT